MLAAAKGLPDEMVKLALGSCGLDSVTSYNRVPCRIRSLSLSLRSVVLSRERPAFGPKTMRDCWRQSDGCERIAQSEWDRLRHRAERRRNRSPHAGALDGDRPRCIAFADEATGGPPSGAKRMTSVFSARTRNGTAQEFYEYPNLTVEYRDASHRYWLHHVGARTASRCERHECPEGVWISQNAEKVDRGPLARRARWVCSAAMGELDRRGSFRYGWTICVRRHTTWARTLRLTRVGAGRGTRCHAKVLEFWASGSRRCPDLANYPAEIRGYVQVASCSWLLRVARPKPTAAD